MRKEEEFEEILQKKRKNNKQTERSEKTNLPIMKKG